MNNFEERPRKVHLFQNNKGVKFRRGNPAKQVDNTLCKSNHGDNGLLTTAKDSEVTCKRCLALMPGRSENEQLTEMLNNCAEDCNKQHDELYAKALRIEKLERTLAYALSELGGERERIVHTPTMTTLGELIEGVLAAKVTVDG